MRNDPRPSDRPEEARAVHAIGRALLRILASHLRRASGGNALFRVLFEAGTRVLPGGHTRIGSRQPPGAVWSAQKQPRSVGLCGLAGRPRLAGPTLASLWLRLCARLSCGP
jgi:hypothetical protein